MERVNPEIWVGKIRPVIVIMGKFGDLIGRDKDTGIIVFFKPKIFPEEYEVGSTVAVEIQDFKINFEGKISFAGYVMGRYKVTEEEKPAAEVYEELKQEYPITDKLFKLEGEVRKPEMPMPKAETEKDTLKPFEERTETTAGEPVTVFPERETVVVGTKDDLYELPMTEDIEPRHHTVDLETGWVQFTLKLIKVGGKNYGFTVPRWLSGQMGNYRKQGCLHHRSFAVAFRLLPGTPKKAKASKRATLTEITPLKCPYCPTLKTRFFVTKSGLKRHIQDKHSGKDLRFLRGLPSRSD